MPTLKIFNDIIEPTLYEFSSFVERLEDNSEATIEICSCGGLVFWGSAIFQMMQEAQARGVKFTAKVYGLAASSAADIVLSCDRIEMAATASIMIHSAYNDKNEKDEGIVIANEAQLSVIQRRLPNYSEDDLKQDRWFRADEALAIGLIDSIISANQDLEQVRMAARYIASCSKHLLGGLVMNEEVKAEVVEAKVEAKAAEEEMEDEKKEEEAKAEVKAAEDEKKDDEDGEPDLVGTLEAMAKQIASLSERLAKLESAKAECGDKKDNARLKAVFDRISAVCAPACEKVEPVTAKEQEVEDPQENLNKCKTIYGSFKKYIEQD